MKKKTSYLLINSVEIFLKEEWNKSSFQIKKESQTETKFINSNLLYEAGNTEEQRG